MLEELREHIKELEDIVNQIKRENLTFFDEDVDMTMLELWYKTILKANDLIQQFYKFEKNIVNNFNNIDLDLHDIQEQLNYIGEDLEQIELNVFSRLDIKYEGQMENIIDNKVNEVVQGLLDTKLQVINTAIENLENKIENIDFSELQNQIDDNSERITILEGNEVDLTPVNEAISKIEEKDKEQDFYIKGLFNENDDKRITTEGVGNSLKLTNSVEGFVGINKIVGNTMYYNNDTGELTDTFIEDANLTLVSSFEDQLVTDENDPNFGKYKVGICMHDSNYLFGKGGRL